jgi:hypothetical protein
MNAHMRPNGLDKVQNLDRDAPWLLRRLLH